MKMTQEKLWLVHINIHIKAENHIVNVDKKRDKKEQKVVIY